MIPEGRASSERSIGPSRAAKQWSDTTCFAADHNNYLGYPLEQEFIRAIEGHPVSGTVLEIGSGEGRLTSYLVDQVESLVAADPYVRPNIVSERLQYLPLEAVAALRSVKRVTAVIASDYVSIVENLDELFQAIWFALPERGIFIFNVQTPADDTAIDSVDVGSGRRMSHPGFFDVYFYEDGSMRNSLERHGFNVISAAKYARADPPHPHYPRSHTHFYELFVAVRGTT